MKGSAAMPAKVLMDVAEYLHASFDGPDCEYLDGEVVERNMEEKPHSKLQMELAFLLRGMAPNLGIQVLPEIRIPISSRRYRVADIAVWRAGDIGERIPTVRPFLVIEILSPEDRITRMQPKIQDYLSIGVECIWLVDPDEQKAISYSRQNPTGSLTDVLRTTNPDIEISLSAVFQGPQ
jgi:Uma2 family endonuclease